MQNSGSYDPADEITLGTPPSTENQLTGGDASYDSEEVDTTSTIVDVAIDAEDDELEEGASVEEGLELGELEQDDQESDEQDSEIESSEINSIVQNEPQQSARAPRMNAAPTAQGQTVLNVGSQTELENAFSQINSGDVDAEYIISFTNDITYNGVGLQLAKGTTTILGNGYTLAWATISQDPRYIPNLILMGNSAVLNLGAPEQNSAERTEESKITFDGCYDYLGESSYRGSMFYLMHNAQLNIYEGVTIQKAWSDTKDEGGAITVVGDQNYTPEINMYGGTIANCLNWHQYGAGGAINLSNNSTFNMYDGVISHCRSFGFGGAVAMNVAVLSIQDEIFNYTSEALLPCAMTLIDGTIEHNGAMGYYGGGVAVGVNSRFEMQGGIVGNNQGVQGGGLCVGLQSADDNAYAIISGGEIRENAARYGAGICNEFNTVLMIDGLITKNWMVVSNASTDQVAEGCGVFNAGTFIMSGGTITDNQARWGGGIFNEGDLVLLGGSVYNNRADRAGKDIMSSNNVVEHSEILKNFEQLENSSLTLQIIEEIRAVNPSLSMSDVNTGVTTTDDEGVVHTLTGWELDSSGYRATKVGDPALEPVFVYPHNLADYFEAMDGYPGYPGEWLCLVAASAPELPEQEPEPPAEDPKPKDQPRKDIPLPETSETKDSPKPSPKSQMRPASIKRGLPRTGSGLLLPQTGDLVSVALPALIGAGGVALVAAAALLIPKRLFSRKR